MDAVRADETGSFTYVFNMNDENPSWQRIALTENGLQNLSGSSSEKNSNSAHTHGSNAFGPFTYSWSGTENNGGVHGSAYLEQVFGPPFNTTIQVTLETECIMKDGNEVVYGGVITQVANSPFPPGGPYDIGNTLYFKVIDNGQGANAAPDQYVATVAIVPSFTGTRCGVFTPSHPLWSNPIFGGLQDVLKPGSVKVN
jgi:hypothetical protein